MPGGGGRNRARVVLRVNPDVDAGTHAKIATGRADDKFGIGHEEAAALYAEAAALDGIEPLGFAVHIGSQIASRRRSAPPSPGSRRWSAGCGRPAMRCRWWIAAAGSGVRYRDEPEGSPRALAHAIRDTLGGLGLRLVIEPGRWLVAPAGVLLSRVVRVKQSGTDRPPFVVLDAAMNDLLRPSLYEAWHGVVPSRRAPLRRGRRRRRTWSGRSARPATRWRATAGCRPCARATGSRSWTPGPTGR